MTVLEIERVTAVCTTDAHVRLNTARGVTETKVGTESAKTCRRVIYRSMRAGGRGRDSLDE